MPEGRRFKYIVSVYFFAITHTFMADKSENFSTVDSYFFAYPQDLQAALEQIKDTVRTYRPPSEGLPEATVIDTTGAKSIAAFPPTPQSQDKTSCPGFNDTYWSYARQSTEDDSSA
jgi:hypothetical protein